MSYGTVNQEMGRGSVGLDVDEQQNGGIRRAGELSCSVPGNDKPVRAPFQRWNERF